MKTLHILRSVRDETAGILIDKAANEGEAAVLELFGEDIDWARVVDEIFVHDKVICWW